VDDDLVLIEKARLGCLTSKGTLVGKYRLIAVKAAGRYNCKGRLIETGDLIQEGMLGLLRAIELYDASRGCTFSHYARCKIQGTVRDAWERQLRADELEQEVIDTGVEQRLIDKQFWKDVFDACLDARERRVIRLRMWDQLSYDDIGDKLSLSDTQVERILGTALLKLKTYLIANDIVKELGNI
jgi:RNA polymerase sigma factor (sigma-70 family)